MAGSHAEIKKHVKTYIAVFVALAIATVLTVAASQIHVSQPVHIAIALFIAVVKASMVAAIFMHLKWEKAACIWWSLAICAVFFVVLMLLPVLTTQEGVGAATHSTWG